MKTFYSLVNFDEVDYIPLELIQKVPDRCTITAIVTADLTESAILDRVREQISFPCVQTGQFLLDDKKFESVFDNCYEAVYYQPIIIKKLPEEGTFKLYKYTENKGILKLQPKTRTEILTELVEEAYKEGLVGGGSSISMAETSTFWENSGIKRKLEAVLGSIDEED